MPRGYGAPPDIDKAHYKVTNAAARIANQKMRDEFLVNRELLHLAKLKKKSMATLLRGWSPLVPDWANGMALRLRFSEYWLMAPEYYPTVVQIVTDSMQEAIMANAKVFLSAVLYDTLTSEDPYYPLNNE